MRYKFDAQKTYECCRDVVRTWSARAVNYIQGELEKRRTEREKYTPQDRATTTTATATWIIALLALVTMIVSHGQLSVMQQQLTDSETAQRNTEEQLRASLALVGVVGGIGFDMKTGEPTLGFNVQIQNVGGTRTAWTTGWGSGHYFPQKIPVSLDVSKPYETPVGPSGIYVIPPNGFVPLPALGVPIASGLDAVAGKGFIVLWGKGTYATIYDPKRAIPVQFCLVMMPHKAASAPPAAQKQPAGGAQTVVPSALGGTVWFAQPYRPDCNQSD